MQSFQRRRTLQSYVVSIKMGFFLSIERTHLYIIYVAIYNIVIGIISKNFHTFRLSCNVAIAQYGRKHSCEWVLQKSTDVREILNLVMEVFMKFV